MFDQEVLNMFRDSDSIDLDTVQRGSVSGKEESDNCIHYLDTVQRARDNMSYLL